MSEAHVFFEREWVMERHPGKRQLINVFPTDVYLNKGKSREQIRARVKDANAGKLESLTGARFIRRGSSETADAVFINKLEKLYLQYRASLVSYGVSSIVVESHAEKIERLLQDMKEVLFDAVRG